jgi:Transposase IS66 family/IS66 C-terminal element
MPCDLAPLQTSLAEGLRYARNQRVGLERFLDDGRLPIHNNMSELTLRREAVGRKNWLFVGSDDGGAVNAAFTSLLASCRLCGVEPWAYLRDIVCLLPRWPEHRLVDLAPVAWTKTRDSNETQKVLDANRFRRLTLDGRAGLDEHRRGSRSACGKRLDGRPNRRGLLEDSSPAFIPIATLRGRRLPPKRTTASWSASSTGTPSLPTTPFYAVSKATGEATPLDDDSAYRPKTWR